MTKVDIISGFLGAGKTTFIRELISKVYQDEKIVLIENEFGEIGIDSRFMQNAGIQVTEMNSGCICCTLVGDFAVALKKVVEEYHPDHILIEPSGVGKLSDVARAVLDMREEAGVTLHSSITVVDGKKIRMYMKNFGEFFNNQIEHASVLVVSRTQSMDERKLKECVGLIREHNEHAPLITTPWEHLSGEAIAEAIEANVLLKAEDCECGCGHDSHAHGHVQEDHHHSEYEHHHGTHGHEAHDHHEGHDHCHDGHHHGHHDHHHADEVFSSWGMETVHQFARTELEDILKFLSVSRDFGTVLRAKGIVAADDGTWMEFDMVPEELELRTCRPDYTGRLCVIGTELNEKALKELFQQ